MREIKFRAWHPSNREMVVIDNIKGSKDPNRSMQLCALMANIHDEGKDLLMQYTGLKDKNGKEIYEGDVLSLLGEDLMLPKPTFDNGMITVVSFSDGCFVAPGSMMTLMSVAHSRVVIGNIHENPELLEKDNAN